MQQQHTQRQWGGGSIDSTYGFVVTTTSDNKLIIQIKTRRTRQQWQTIALAMEDFTGKDNKIPHAQLNDYAESIALSLKNDPMPGNVAMDIGKGGKALWLTITIPIQWHTHKTPVKYQFELHEIPQDPVDCLTARVHDVEDALDRVAATVSRVLQLLAVLVVLCVAGGVHHIFAAGTAMPMDASPLIDGRIHLEHEPSKNTGVSPSRLQPGTCYTFKERFPTGITSAMWQNVGDEDAVVMLYAGKGCTETVLCSVAGSSGSCTNARLVEAKSFAVVDASAPIVSEYKVWMSR